MDRQPLPLSLAVAMVAAFLGGMVAIKLVIAPWIVAEFGFVGVIAWVLACLAAGKALED